MSLVYIALGGALGAVLRWLSQMGVSAYMQQPYPYGTLFVNIIGCFLMGICMAIFMKSQELFSQEFRMFLTIGVLGSFTTFSTFSADVLMLFMRGAVWDAVGYILASFILSLGALVLGSFLVWRYSAL